MLDSFVRFDDMLIERVFSPICEWTYTHFNISNYGIAKYLCLATVGCDFYDIYQQGMTYHYGNAAVDLLVLLILVTVLYFLLREDHHPPGTMSIFRANYLGRFFVFTGNIVTSLFVTSGVFTTPVMSNLLVLIYYFMACDKPKGDRFVFKTAVHETQL